MIEVKVLRFADCKLHFQLLRHFEAHATDGEESAVIEATAAVGLAECLDAIHMGESVERILLDRVCRETIQRLPDEFFPKWCPV